MASWLNEVEKVFEKYGIPKHIWYPIMVAESSGNPKTRNVTPNEESVGLFQINLKAHPEYRHLDLTNPVINAEIAARDFIAPKWKIAKALPDPGSQALYIWKWGIKPNWNLVQEKGLDDKVASMAKQIYNDPEYKDKSFEDQLRGTLNQWGKENIINPMWEWGKENILPPILQTVTVIVLILLAVFSFYQVFRPEIQQVQRFTKIVTKAVRK